MSVTALQDGVKGREVTRWVTLLEEVDDETAPAFSVELTYLTESAILRISKPWANKSLTQKLNDRAFMKAFVRAACRTKQWRGLTKQNLYRFGDFFLRHPEVVAGYPDVVPFPEEDEQLNFLLDHMSTIHFYRLFEAAQSLEDYAHDVIEKEKNDSGPSSDSQ